MTNGEKLPVNGAGPQRHAADDSVHAKPRTESQERKISSCRGRGAGERGDRRGWEPMETGFLFDTMKRPKGECGADTVTILKAAEWRASDGRGGWYVSYTSIELEWAKGLFHAFLKINQIFLRIRFFFVKCKRTHTHTHTPL